MKSSFEKKILAFAIIALFFGISIIPSIASIKLNTVEAENDKDYSFLPPEGLILPSSNAQALPLLSSLFKHRGINIYVEWGEGELVEFEDVSSFSSLLALDYWSVSDKAIVVN